MKKSSKNKIKSPKKFGAAMELIFLIILISIVSFVFKLIGISGYKTESGSFETTLLVTKNILSKGGIKYILNNTLKSFQLLEPLILTVLSLISVSVLESSGLLKHLFSPLKKIKFRYVVFFVIFIGIISTIIGDYSYAILLPLSGILYKYLDKDSSLGVITMFIAITIGYGTGIFYNYQSYELGNITELSAQSIINNYNFELLSNIFILIFSALVLTLVGTLLITRLSKKYPRIEYTDNLNTSKTAARFTFAILIIMIIGLIYCIIPSLPHSGMLLDKTQPTYIGKLFGQSSPLNQGFMFLVIFILTICGFIYGKISKNLKNGRDCSIAFTKTFENTGYIFVLLFFACILNEILDWTNLSTIISTNIIDFVGRTTLSGLILVIASFISIVLVSVFIPGSVAKWNIVAPVYVPLLMRANITPTFIQTIFVAADSAGKLFSPIYFYLMIAIGFIYKYSKDSGISIFTTMKRMMPIISILAVVWLVIIIGWYLTGLPIGINTSISL